MAGLTSAERKVLAVVASADVVASWSNRHLTALAQRKLVTEHFLKQPNGRLSPSKRWSITDAGRAAVEAA